jgi:hypothetical protein
MNGKGWSQPSGTVKQKQGTSADAHMLQVCCLVKTQVCPSQMNACEPWSSLPLHALSGVTNVAEWSFAGDRLSGFHPVHETADFCSMK